MSQREEELEGGSSDEVMGGEILDGFFYRVGAAGWGWATEGIVGGGWGGVNPPERDDTSGWFTCTMYGSRMFM